MFLKDLGLSRDRTINSFEDLKGIFTEIDSVLGNRPQAIRINEILKHLPGTGAPSQMEA